MPVTIHTLTSSVNVTEGAIPNAELMEHIVQAVLSRLRQEHDDDKRLKEERKMSDRMSPKDDY
jgi:hypothetical protein